MKGFSLTGLCPFYLSVFRIGLPLTFPFIIDPEVIEGVPKQFFRQIPRPLECPIRKRIEAQSLRSLRKTLWKDLVKFFIAQRNSYLDYLLRKLLLPQPQKLMSIEDGARRPGAPEMRTSREK